MGVGVIRGSSRIPGIDEGLLLVVEGAPVLVLLPRAVPPPVPMHKAVVLLIACSRHVAPSPPSRKRQTKTEEHTR